MSPRPGRVPAPCRACGSFAQPPINRCFHEAALPAPHAGLGQAGPAHHFGCAAALGRGQDDPRSPRKLLGAVAIAGDCLQPLPIARPEPDLDTASHFHIVARKRPKGIFCIVQTTRYIIRRIQYFYCRGKDPLWAGSSKAVQPVAPCQALPRTAQQPWLICVVVFWSLAASGHEQWPRRQGPRGGYRFSKPPLAGAPNDVPKADTGIRRMAAARAN